MDKSVVHVVAYALDRAHAYPSRAKHWPQKRAGSGPDMGQRQHSKRAPDLNALTGLALPSYEDSCTCWPEQ